MLSATQGLAKFAAELSYEDIPGDVVHQAERLILDTCCCAIGGYILDGGKVYLHVLEGLGGKPESTLLPTGHKTSAAIAAFVNSQLANLLDLDENLLYEGHFANTSIMPPLAMAERQGASGKQFVTAVVAAFEVTSRVTLSLPGIANVVSPPPNLKIEWPDPFGHSYNIFGATVGSCSLLNLNAEQTANAMGIAGTITPLPSSGKIASLPRLTMSKSSVYGWQGWSGVVASLLAEQGMTGDTTVLDGEHGFWKMIGAKYCDFAMLTKDLGSKWWIMDTAIKPYPACAYMRHPMTATDKIIAAHNIKPEEIDLIVAKLRPVHNTGVFFQDEPESYLDTQVSYQYTIAMRALQIPPDRWHKREVYSDPFVRSMVKKVRIEPDPSAIEAVYEDIKEGQEIRRPKKNPTTVEIHARGTVYSEHVDYAKGDPFTEETRMTDEELANKFRTHTTDLLRSSHVEQAIEALLNISTSPDIRLVTPLLTA
ncbi:MmgE/PrpD family protein [Chloroflexota bacterium]